MKQCGCILNVSHLRERDHTAPNGRLGRLGRQQQSAAVLQTLVKTQRSRLQTLEVQALRHHL